MQKKPFDTRLVRNEISGCLEWQGPVDKDGYGWISTSSHNGHSKAHRYAWWRVNGEIPAGFVIRHRCDNPSCCELTHLILGTHQENMDDRKVRNRGAKGEKDGRAKLTNEMVLEIRKLYAEGITQVKLAALYPVTQSSISLIVLRKQWTHI